MAEPLPELIPVAVLQVGSNLAAIALDSTLGALQLDRVTAVPLADEALRGITVAGDEAVLVVDLGRLAAGDISEGRRSSLERGRVGLLCREAGESVVVVGAQVKAVARVRRSRARAATALGRCARIMVEWRGALVPLLSVAKLLDLATEPAPAEDEEARERW